MVLLPVYVLLNAVTAVLTVKWKFQMQSSCHLNHSLLVLLIGIFGVLDLRFVTYFVAWVPDGTVSAVWGDWGLFSSVGFILSVNASQIGETCFFSIVVVEGIWRESEIEFSCTHLTSLSQLCSLCVTNTFLWHSVLLPCMDDFRKWDSSEILCYHVQALTVFLTWQEIPFFREEVY